MKIPFISLKKHKSIVADLNETVANLEMRLRETRRERDNAQCLSEILSNLAIKYANLGISCSGSLTVKEINGIRPENIATLVRDLCTGGVVVEQLATKAIVVKPDGTVLQGKTTLPPDKGFIYRLERH